MERSAIVKASNMTGRGNKEFKCGDTVYEHNFPQGNFDKLIAGGWIEEVKKNTTEDPEKPKKK